MVEALEFKFIFFQEGVCISGRSKEQGGIWFFIFYKNSWGDSMDNSVVLTEKPEIHKHTTEG